MDAINKRLEGSNEYSGLQAVLRCEDLGPSHRLGRAVHVPDSDARALQRKPHPLFCLPQGLDRPIPFGDIGATTERADDLPGVIPQHPVAPFDQPFVTRLGENRVLDNRQIAADQVIEGVSECQAMSPVLSPNSTSLPLSSL